MESKDSLVSTTALMRLHLSLLKERLVVETKFYPLYVVTLKSSPTSNKP